MWPPLELSVTIASLIPHLQERFTTTGDDILGGGDVVDAVLDEVLHCCGEEGPAPLADLPR
jgi:hypothetical protein